MERRSHILSLKGAAPKSSAQKPCSRSRLSKRRSAPKKPKLRIADALVLANLEHEGLEPSLEASPDALARGMLCTMTGLLTSPSDIAAANDCEGRAGRPLGHERSGERRASV